MHMTSLKSIIVCGPWCRHRR